MQALRKDLTKKNTFSYRHCSHCIGGRPPAQIGFDALLTLFDSGGKGGGGRSTPKKTCWDYSVNDDLIETCQP